MKSDDAPRLPTAEQLFEDAPCGLLVTATNGTILKVNRTFCKWLGVNSAELVGQTKIQELFTVGARIFHQTHWLPMLEMKGSLQEVKFELRSKAGRNLPMLMNVVRRIDEFGARDEISAVLAEERNKYERELLAERKRVADLLAREQEAQRTLTLAQARLRQAIQVGEMYVWDIAPATRVRRFDDSVAKLLGFAAPQPVTEDMFWAAIAPAERAKAETALARALSESGRYRSTYTIHGVDGAQRLVASYGQATFNSDRSLAEFVGILTDITETTTLRAAAEDRAVFAEQMIGIVSHDLRNPLATVLMAAQVLNRSTDLKSEKTAKMLRNIDAATRRAQRLVADLLDFTAARVGQGLTISLQSVDIQPLVAQAVEELTLAFPGRDLLYRHVGASGGVMADADRITQLLGNLVANAMTYGDPRGAVTVTSSSGPESFRLAVHNYGEPIPVEKLHVIFEPLVRGTSADNPLRSVGLGLFIVRAIASAHNGEVTVRSNAEQGTEFALELPRLGTD